MAVVEIPVWDGSRECRRAWNRRVASLGKRPVFEVLKPLITVLLQEVRNVDAGASDQSDRYLAPTARSAIAAQAIAEIDNGVFGEHCALVRRSELALGLQSQARLILEAAQYLVIAMENGSAFEKDVILCLSSLSSLDPRHVESVRQSLVTSQEGR